MKKFKIGDYIINKCNCHFIICQKTRNKFHKIIEITNNGIIIDDPDIGLWGVNFNDAFLVNSYKIKEKLGVK